jgi:cytochrome c-type biogenesis protein CcsB
VSPADFATFSDNAVMFASIVYILAFLAHLTEWVLVRSLPVSSEPVRAPQPVAERRTVPVAAGSVERPPGAFEAPEGPVQPPEDWEAREQRVEKYGRIGVALTVVGCLLHFSALVARGLGSDPVRVPWGNMYEFTLAGTFGVSLMYLVLMRRHHLRWMGVLVTAFLVVVLMLDVLVLYQDAGPLVPALHSYWLAVHVLAAVVASGAFSVAALTLVLFLAKDRAVRRGTLRPRGYLSRLPAAEALERVAYRLNAFAFPIWTFAALVAGPIWAEYAWGSYWNWDPKEVWAFITWVIYAAYLHARATAGWKGKAASVIALVGFASLLFNFVGINYFFGSGSLHSYAG